MDPKNMVLKNLNYLFVQFKNYYIIVISRELVVYLIMNVSVIHYILVIIQFRND